MIIDNLETIDRFLTVSGNVAVAIRFLRTTDLTTLEPGKHQIDGDSVFAIVNEYTTKHPAGISLEGHRRYIDVQYMVHGCELFGYAPLRGQPFVQTYDAEKDIAFFEGTPSFFLLEKGMCAICYPHDLHMPGIVVDSPSPVRKVILKVKV